MCKSKPKPKIEAKKKETKNVFFKCTRVGACVYCVLLGLDSVKCFGLTYNTAAELACSPPKIRKKDRGTGQLYPHPPAYQDMCVCDTPICWTKAGKINPILFIESENESKI